jgi:hypothetical protein
MARYMKFPIVKLQCTEENDWMSNENTVRYNGKEFKIQERPFFHFSLD